MDCYVILFRIGMQRIWDIFRPFANLCISILSILQQIRKISYVLRKYLTRNLERRSIRSEFVSFEDIFLALEKYN